MNKIVSINKSTDPVISNEEEVGFIYILSHVSGRNTKIGETKVCPRSREKDYVKTYDLKGFRLHKFYEVAASDRKFIEREIHKALRENQLSGLGAAREIFACTVDEACYAAEKAIANAHKTQKLRIEKTKREKKEQLKRVKEQQRKTEEIQLQKRAESAWASSDKFHEWNQKLLNFEKQFPLEQEVKLYFEPNLFKMNIVLGAFLFYTFFIPLLCLSKAAETATIWPLFILIPYAMVVLKLGGAFDRSYSTVPNKVNIEKFKDLQKMQMMVKETFIAQWKTQNPRLQNPSHC